MAGRVHSFVAVGPAPVHDRTGRATFPLAVLALEEAWPASIRQAATIRRSLCGDIISGDPTRVRLASNKRPNPDRWTAQGWAIEMEG